MRRTRVSVSKSFVAYTLWSRQHAVVLKRHELRARVPASMPVNAVWGVGMTGKVDGIGRLHAMLGIVDHGSRRLLALRALPSKSAWTLLGHLCLAIAEFGRPRSVRADNESVFVGLVFSGGLQMRGIRHQRTTPGCPWHHVLSSRERSNRSDLAVRSGGPGAGKKEPRALAGQVVGRLDGTVGEVKV